MHTVTKDQFVAVLDAAGVSEAQKHRLHAEFEQRYPQGHQQFLEWLGLTPQEVTAVRERSRR